MNEEPKIVDTQNDGIDGQNKCPNCGATDISLNTKTGKLRCNYCRHEFEPKKITGMEENISNLRGEVFASGTKNIDSSSENMITLKCSSCGAEVVIDTKSSTQARCHWCRNTLSINSQIPNGAVPDVVLPFKLTKDVAQKSIEEFVGKRKFFAHPKFRSEFTTENIMGVYFPYMVVDVNSHARFHGRGEHEVRSYTRGNSEHKETYYDADLYEVGREFNLAIKGLTVESNSDRLDKRAKDKTNNIINSIMPFDLENCVQWNSNYLSGYSSEKRDTNVDDLRNLVGRQSKDIARFSANETLGYYNRGVRWEHEDLRVDGMQWKSAYLPVWLYSYKQDKGGSSVLHYVAVNARTQETMGSVPIHMPKLLLVSLIIEAIGIAMVYAMSETESNLKYLFLLTGIVYYIVMYARYRNGGAKHHHEIETPKQVSNMNKLDRLIRRETGLRRSRIDGANNTKIEG